MANTYQMTKADYQAYVDQVKDFMARENLANLSRTADCEESYVSRQQCDVCHDSQQGMRLDADGANKDTHSVQEYVICEGCEYFAEYGRLPDTVMESIEGGAQ